MDEEQVQAGGLDDSVEEGVVSVYPTRSAHMAVRTLYTDMNTEAVKSRGTITQHITCSFERAVGRHEQVWWADILASPQETKGNPVAVPRPAGVISAHRQSASH